MASESFIYKGYEVIKNYSGSWTIYRQGETMSEVSKPNEADAKRWIDKYLRREEEK